jgi:site-specific recombinase XerD
MPKQSKPFSISRRKDSDTYRFTISPTSGLPHRVCAEWYKKSFKNLPDELSLHRYPKTKTAAEAAVLAFIAYLRVKQSEGSARKIVFEDITVGDWINKFTSMETSPRAEIKAAENRPLSSDTVDNYLGYYKLYIKDDPFTKLKMSEIEEDDALAFTARLACKKLVDGRVMGGTKTCHDVIGFIRMTFKNYQSRNRRWINPFEYIKKPKYYSKIRDFLSEDEVISLFCPGVLTKTIDLAVCAAIFLSGLRRSEVSALKPEDLDWHTPQINVRRAWQNFENKKKRVLGPPKGKKSRIAPFDPILQEAIKKLWAENGKPCAEYAQLRASWCCRL